MKHTKMKKSLLALTAMVMTLVLCMTTALPAFAAGTNIAPTEKLSFTFNKYLVMANEANVPNATFEFTIASGTAVVATDDAPAIYAGNDTNRVSNFPALKVNDIGSGPSATISFNPGDQTFDVKQTGDTVNLVKGEKYAKKEVTVDFDSVKFNAPGIYRYIITESTSSQDGIANDPTDTRTLDVFVEYQNAELDGQLIVSNYILYRGTKTDATNETTKDDGFTNTYSTNDLTLEKQVTGNQGDRDKYFTFTVNITGAVAGTVYTVDLTNAEENPIVDGMLKTNEKTLTATDRTVTATYYLKDNQSIVIQGLTQNTNYQITENSYTTDGYTTSYVIDSLSSVTSSDTNTQIMGTTDHTVTFTNEKEGSIPTGILLEIAPYIILGVVVLAGFVALFATRRRRTSK